MKVFKFGGASVSTAERIRALPQIIGTASNDKILIVVSAMGKTTNALEKLAESFFGGDRVLAEELFGGIKAGHLSIAESVLLSELPATRTLLGNIFTEVEWLLHDRPARPYDYYYDQIVCIGELLSTAIVSAYLREAGVGNVWVDVRDIFATDDNFRNASVLWDTTRANVEEKILPIFSEHRIVVTQGFIGSTDTNESTTLGREGSDYSAAIFANLLNAESQTIWKDVEGVMNADPKTWPAAVVIHELNYTEVIEMAFYGAQVIHPKTIKPLQNKGIPLLVKCFLDPSLAGTVINDRFIGKLPPIIVRKANQTLLDFRSRDFSFVGEKLTGWLYEQLAGLHLQPNLIQSGAVILQVCIDDDAAKTESLALNAAEYFDVGVEKGLTMLTVRHDNGHITGDLIGERTIVLQQRSAETIQTLVR